MTKLTKKDYFNEVIAILNGEDVNNIEKSALVDFMNKELETYTKKLANRKSKPDKRTMENQTKRNVLYEMICDSTEPVSINALNEAFPDYTHQRIGSLISPLIKDNKVARVIVDKVVCYKQI